jgi:hypothetical protein
VFAAAVHAQQTHARPTVTLGEVLVLTAVEGAPAPAASGSGHLFTADRGSRRGQSVLLSTDRQKAPAGDGRRLEYQLLSPEKVGPLPAVDVLGIHYTKVRPDRVQAFERFVAEKLHPAVGNLRPDLRVLYYRLASGSDASNYIALFALTRESRDKYWPKGADSDELRAAFSPAVKALTAELGTYLVDGSYAADPKLAAAVYESREWTDFVLVPPAR